MDMSEDELNENDDDGVPLTPPTPGISYKNCKNAACMKYRQFYFVLFFLS